MPRYAVIDVGTNSVKFHVGDAAADGRWTTVVDRAEVTRLGEGLAATGGEFSPSAMERTVAAIAAMAAEAKQAGAVAIAAVGTMGMRTRATARPSSTKWRSAPACESRSSRGQKRVAWPISR